MSNLTVKDLEILQGTLNQVGLDYQLELDEGKILVTGLSDIISSEVGVQLIRLLGNWVYPRRLGRLFDSSGAFILSDTNLKVPDVSFVRAQRLKKSVRYFGELVPDLVV
ncbi:MULTISPECIES: Uma2 family endonuclease [unclassified Okeania]|uniref:Uma2 family endonuclease n=1 Tax=unclassified Okeania TaxID=2634635 RepID=UPI00257A0C33|nr:MULTISPECIES: Uma2 family endonuclease [unclassified Okeania]